MKKNHFGIAILAVAFLAFGIVQLDAKMGEKLSLKLRLPQVLSTHS